MRKSLIFSVEMIFHLIFSVEMLKTQLDVNPGQPALLDPAWVISTGPFQPHSLRFGRNIENVRKEGTSGGIFSLKSKHRRLHGSHKCPVSTVVCPGELIPHEAGQESPLAFSSCREQDTELQPPPHLVKSHLKQEKEQPHPAASPCHLVPSPACPLSTS